MENIADALKMAGSVVLFVLALSITALAFTQAREGIDAILKYSDREYLTIKGDSRYYYLSNENDTSRYVGKETIIPAIYIAYKESYKIVFKFPDGDGYYLFEQKVTTNNNQTETKKICTIDLLKQSIANDLSSREFLDGILYGDYIVDGKEDSNAYKRKFGINPNGQSLYEYLTEKEKSGRYKIKETIGTYYIEDLEDAVNKRNDKYSNGEIKDPNISEINKQEKRVITYTFELK